MAIEVSKNLYRGVNPHLNSLFQTPGTEEFPADYRSFHTVFIGQMIFHFNERLPNGYVARAEESFRVIGTDASGKRFKHNPRPDVAIKSRGTVGAFAGQSVAAQPTWEAKVLDTIDPLDSINAVTIHDVSTNQIVTCIEVLSPANKTHGSYYSVYRARRAEYIYSQIPLVEIDFLHETEAIIPRHPIYPDDANSFPYYIAVTDSRPHVDKTRVYGFSINDPIPTLPIPLLDIDVVLADFDAIYQTVFKGARLGDDVDYTQLPERFETYSADDQARIKARMAEIAEEYGDKQS
jgi:hypothetical protein